MYSRTTHIINISLLTGKFPSFCKYAQVIPIWKGGDTSEHNNYRPISILPVIGKCIEYFASQQLTEYIETNQLFSNQQYGFRKNYSTTYLMIDLFDDIYNSKSKSKKPGIIFLDIKKAFDTVDHKILLDKLYYYGIKDTALEWIKSFLSDRVQCTKVNNKATGFLSLTCGVPQGTVLGPILFALYTQEVHKIIESYGLMFHMFADDMQIYTVYKGNESDLIPLNNCLNQVKLWANCNYLKLNDNKTKFLRVTSEKPRIKHLDCKLLDLEVTVFEKQVKNLGVIVDQKLSFKSQINKVCQLGYFMLKNLWRISDKISSIELRIQIIHSCITSHIDYCNSLFVNLPQCDINKLLMLMNASVRFIYSLRRSKDISITYYLKKCHFLPVKLRVNFKICVLVYKCQHESAPEYLTELLQEKDSLESLRVYKDRSLLKIENLNQLDYKNRRFSVIAPILWNNLPRETRESESLFIFKKRLKTFYFDQF